MTSGGGELQCYTYRSVGKGKVCIVNPCTEICDAKSCVIVVQSDACSLTICRRGKPVEIVTFPSPVWYFSAIGRSSRNKSENKRTKKVQPCGTTAIRFVQLIVVTVDFRLWTSVCLKITASNPKHLARRPRVDALNGKKPPVSSSKVFDVFGLIPTTKAEASRASNQATEGNPLQTIRSVPVNTNRNDHAATRGNTDYENAGLLQKTRPRVESDSMILLGVQGSLPLHMRLVSSGRNHGYTVLDLGTCSHAQDTNHSFQAPISMIYFDTISNEILGRFQLRIDRPNDDHWHCPPREISAIAFTNPALFMQSEKERKDLQKSDSSPPSCGAKKVLGYVGLNNGHLTMLRARFT